MSDQRLRELMQDLYDAHRSFRSEFDAWQSAGRKSPEPGEVKAGRARFWDALHRLFNIRLDPLRSGFSADPKAWADAVIDFLEIDIPAHRCGYEKEKYLRKLKSVELNERQRERLKRVALELVSSGNFRREFGDWSKLMIVLADASFVESLRGAIAPLDIGRARYGERMLRTIQDNRPDLKTGN